MSRPKLVHDQAADPPQGDSRGSGAGGGNGIDVRLRALEITVARIDERIKGLAKTVASKAWVLGGVLNASLIAFGTGVTLLKLFSPPPS